jgi:ABC-type lipoprotein release transport system permease subunit
MDNLFGIPLSSYLIALTLLVVLIGAVLVYIWWHNPLLVRLGLRNVVRRKTQTTLIVIGMMLATLIVSAAFATGDTVGYSVTNQIYNDLQEADVVLAFDRNVAPPGVTQLTDEDVNALRDALSDDADVEGVSGITQTRVPAINTVDQRAEPLATLAGVDPGSVDVFNGLVSLDGEYLSAAELTGDNVYITDRLSEEIGVGDGDRFTIYYGNQPYELTVAGVVRDNAMTSNAEGQDADSATAGGIVTSLQRWREITGEADRIDLVAVSAVGGVRDSLSRVDGVEERVDDYIDASGAPMEVILTKQELVDLAELIGSIFVTFFVVFGLFSIAAGVMLIFLMFIMLAAERRSEMGMARAVGMKRMHLTESFIAEGMAYNIGSAMVGALLGLAVAGVLIWAMSQIFDDFGLDITFHFNIQGFVIAYFLGLVITFATVAFSSWRAANLNIVEAIRDLPDQPAFRSRRASLKNLWPATVAAGWTMAWIALIALVGLTCFSLFTTALAIDALGVAAVPLGVLLAGLFAGLFGYGLILIQPGRFGRMKGGVSWLVWAAWMFVCLPLNLVAWGLLLTRGWASRQRNMGGWAVWMLIIGALATWWGGWPGSMAFAYTAGTTLFVFAVAMLAVYFGVKARPAFTIASLLVLWYWLLPLPFSFFVDDATNYSDPLLQLSKLFGLEPAEEVNGGIEMFFVSGIAMTAAATLFVIFNADLLLGAVNALTRVLGGITPAMRMAISYPLASRFRTGMTLAMFTLVVFSLVVMATLNSNFTQLFLGNDAKGGFDVRVNGSTGNRIPDLRAALEDAGYDVDANISGIGTLLTDDPQMKPTNLPVDFATYRIQGMDEEFIRLADLKLTTRAEGYDSDEAVFQAILNDPTLAVVDESRTAPADPFSPDDEVFKLGVETEQLRDQPWAPIPVTVRSPDTGKEFEVKVIGVLEPQVTSVTPAWLALFTNRSVVEDNLGGDMESFYLTTFDKSKSGTIEVASSIEAALLQRGVVADSLEQSLDDAAAQSTAFQYLFEGFMGLGLIVGIAALGVIAFRTVAERRQQIGMLRALGYTRRLVALAFFMESSFIALAGIGMGLFLGAALSYNLLTSPELIGESGTEVDFHFPLLRLLVIVGIAYGASALMTFIPARSASHVPVAEALRYAG